MIRILIAVACLACTNASADQPRIDGLATTEFGLYCVIKGKVMPELGTVSGVYGAASLGLRATTRTIPARRGVRFGFSFEIVGAPAGAKVDITVVNRYPAPGLQKPGSPTVLREHYVLSTKVGAEAFVGEGLDEPWDMVPGEWTFELWQGERKLAEESFLVIDSDDGQPPCEEIVS